MTIELQDRVWHILPKEFKEEVKEIYSNAITYHPCGYNHKTDLLKIGVKITSFFGTSESKAILEVYLDNPQCSINFAV